MLGLEQSLLALIAGVVCIYLPRSYLIISEAQHRAAIEKLSKNLDINSPYVCPEKKGTIKKRMRAQFSGELYGRLISTLFAFVFQLVGCLISVWSIISLLINFF